MRIVSLLLTALLALPLWVRAAENAPAVPDAREFLSLIQSFYDQTTSISASFAQDRYTKAYDQHDRAKGRVVFRKPGKMRWDYQEPNVQVYLAANNKLLIYQAGSRKGESGQITEQKLSDDDLPAVFAFLTGTGSLSDNFNAKILKTPKKSNGLYVLQLQPTSTTPQYEELLFGVQLFDKGGKRAALVRRVVIVDHAGNWNQFDFRDIKFNPSISATHFSFEPPKGTRRINAL